MASTLVDIPGVGRVEFPDSMSPDEINAAAKRLHDEAVASATPPPVEKPGLTTDPLGYGKTLLSNIIPSAGKAATDTLEGLVGIVPALGKVAYEAHPISYLHDLTNNYQAAHAAGKGIKDAAITAVEETPVMPTARAMATGLAKHYYDRYASSPHALTDTLRDDPVGAVLDVLPVADAVGVAGTAGKARIAENAVKAATEAADALPSTAALNSSARNTRIMMDAVKRREANPLYKVATAAEKVGEVASKPTERAGNAVASIVNKSEKPLRWLGTGMMRRAAKPSVATMEDMPLGREGNIHAARDQFVQSLAEQPERIGLNAKGIDRIRKNIDEHQADIEKIIDEHVDHQLDYDHNGLPVYRKNSEDVSVPTVEWYLDHLAAKMRKQVNPSADLEAVERVRQDFRKSAGLPEHLYDPTAPLRFEQNRLQDSIAEVQASMNELQRSIDAAADNKAAQAALQKQQRALRQRKTELQDELNSVNTSIGDVRSQPTKLPHLPLDAAMPFDVAHDMKRGTYAQLRDKYGEMRSAEVEAQKALARGLSEEVQRVAEEIKIPNNTLATLYPTERALKNIVNRLETATPIGLRELMGIGSVTGLVSGNPLAFKAAVLGALWNLNRPEIMFPLGRQAYRAGMRLGDVSSTGIGQAAKVAMLARLIAQANNISEEEAQKIAEAEVNREAQATIK